MDELLRTICSHHGVFLRREALKLGYDDRTFRALLRSGEWHRVRWGAFTFGDIWAAADERARHHILVRAAYRTAKAPVAASHASAVLEHTSCYWNLDLSEVHLTRLDGRTGRREAGVRQHRGRVADGDVAVVNDVKCMSATRAALELTTMAGTEESLVTINGLLHDGKITLDGLKKRYESMRHWPDTLKTELVLRMADARLESAGETRTDFLFWKQGVPRAEPQYEVFNGRGDLVARLDFAWPEHQVWLEFDGMQKYVKYLREGETVADAVMREKQREDLVRRLTGWRCIRITWADLARPRLTGAFILGELRGVAA